MNSRYMPTWQRVAIVAILAVICLIMLTPLWWNVVWATRSTADIFAYPPKMLPGDLLIENFNELQSRVNIWRAFLNSVIATGFTVVGASIFCTLAGFAFAKYKFRFRTPLFILLLSTLAVPSQITVVPLFIMMVQLGWVDTYHGLILPGLIPAFGVYFMRVSAQTAVPDAVIEAARIDGANELRIFSQIAVPSLLPSVATLAILMFGASWGSLFWPLVVLRSNTMFTLPLALTTLLGSYQNPYDLLMVGSLLMMIPPLVLFLFLQRYFIKSVFITGYH